MNADLVLKGGKIVTAAAPEEVGKHPTSYTAEYLREESDSNGSNR